MNMKLQEQTNWCWAAVAAAIHNFRNPNDNQSQGQIATPVLFQEAQISDQINCTLNPELCNFPAALNDAMDILHDLSDGGFKTAFYPHYESIKASVNQGRALAARIVWNHGGAHFVLVDGYFESDDGSEQSVHVQDPARGPHLYHYDDLVSHYPPDGHWQDTYVAKR